MKQKAFSIIFKEISLNKTKWTFLKGESFTLYTAKKHNWKSTMLADDFRVS